MSGIDYTSYDQCVKRCGEVLDEGAQQKSADFAMVYTTAAQVWATLALAAATHEPGDSR